MPSSDELATRSVVIDKSQLDRLIETLQFQGYRVLGPRLEDDVIVYGTIESTADLPRGRRDYQEPAKYRTQAEANDQWFEFNLGPHSWKQFLFPPRESIGSATATDAGWQFDAANEDSAPLAIIGARACELQGIAVQDRVFLQGPYVDPLYAQRRQSAVIIAVNCTVAAATCFCTSMDSGPRCRHTFDLALTELPDGFVVEIGSDRGDSLIAALQTRPMTDHDRQTAERLRQRAVEQISRQLPTENLRDDLMDNLDHPHWDDVAERCLSCTNCTMVCPTCFCSSVEEVPDLLEQRVDRIRKWDSCFNFDFSYTAGGVIRDDRRSRFRQWLTHKLATWHDQFETSGCVGCGRCITWCPVGIDLTEEVAALRGKPNENRRLPVISIPANPACSVDRTEPAQDDSKR